MTMEKKGEKACSDHAKAIEAAAGWAFASVFNNYFGEGSLILAGEGPNGKDLKFFVTEQWLKENHISRFGLGKDEAMIFLNHMDHCDSPECVAAKKKYDAAMPFLRGTKFPGGKAVAFLLSELAGANFTCVISREEGATEAIDELKPFIEWFTGENRKLWVWPKERKDLKKED